MSLTQELRDRHHDLWEAAATHPFVQEMGAGSLPLEKFQRYFLQDYVFLRDFCSLLALGIAKAPTFEVARGLAAFLAGILQGEEGLFRRSFGEWGLRPEQYSPPEAGPAATALGNLMARVAYEGRFSEILTVLVVTEWTYLDWAARLVQGRRVPPAAVCREWTDLHSNQEFQDFVHWLLRTLDEMPLGPEDLRRVEELFHTTLRYELAFWDAAYHGESWQR